ncbi:MAG: DPP IV N-terminal domain-containing protein, partial [Bacteroidetes bacterium]|nr:DPP IV N-terminal domain-containing protein [Bacteroidota bacterium]
MKNLIIFVFTAILSISAQAQTTQKITLEDIFIKGTFHAQSIPGLRSMNDGIHYTTLENSTKIVRYSYKTGEEAAVVFDVTKVEDAEISTFNDYKFSRDETKILLTTDTKKIYRHSFTAEYYVWNSVTDELTKLSDKGAQQLATFSPDGTRVAYVRENNIFLKNLKFGSTSQATFDGKKNEILNGTPDWVYEEEFGFNKAFWWSPDSKFVAFIRFDETEVPEFTMPMYAGETPSYNENKLYPGEETFKYPKAGEKNSGISVKVYDLKSKSTTTVDIGEKTDIYIPRLNWTPNANDLVVM